MSATDVSFTVDMTSSESSPKQSQRRTQTKLAFNRLCEPSAGIIRERRECTCACLFACISSIRCAYPCLPAVEKRMSLLMSRDDGGSDDAPMRCSALSAACSWNHRCQWSSTARITGDDADYVTMQAWPPLHQDLEFHHDSDSSLQFSQHRPCQCWLCLWDFRSW